MRPTLEQGEVKVLRMARQLQDGALRFVCPQHEPLLTCPNPNVNGVRWKIH